MADLFMGRCGCDCKNCKHRESDGCPGCPTAQGKMFWGECEVAKCCLDKGHDHCGQCQEFPCATLRKYADDPEQGDSERLRNLRAWNEIGYEAWTKARAEQPR